MCEFFDKLEAKGEARGKVKGQLELLSNLINKGLLTIQQVAKRNGYVCSQIQGCYDRTSIQLK